MTEQPSEQSNVPLQRTPTRGKSLVELLQFLRARGQVRCIGAGRNVPLQGVTDDSRNVRPGDLFIAKVGERVDGHLYVSEAMRRGAAAVVAERALAVEVPQLIVEKTREAAGEIVAYMLGNPARRLRVIGITGTNGKTTTALCVWRILSEADGRTAGLLSTIQNVLGRDPAGGGLKTETPQTTTPGAVALHRAFAAMVRNGVRSCVMEVSSHGLVQRRVAGISFRAAVLTNISSDHLDYHGTLEAYREAKSLLFRSLHPESAAVLHQDDPSFSFLASVTRARIVPYSLRSGWPALRRCEISLNGPVRLTLADDHGSLSVQTPLWGRHNAENLLAACACCRALDLPWPAVEAGLRAMSPPSGRLEEIPACGFRAFVDYAHTEAALSVVLDAVRPLAKGGRVIVVFGCGGDRDRTKRPAMGRVAAEKADMVYLTSDNPRSERPEAIIGEILLGIPKEAAHVRVEVDRAAAIRKAVREAEAGDVVLVAGKGHEDYQIIGKRRIHFDDRQVLRACLKELSHARM